jgi:hypothetical protein
VRFDELTALFDVYNALAFDRRLNARLQVIDPADRLLYAGRFCDHCLTIAFDISQPNIDTILLHEMTHCSLHARGDQRWGEHG